MVRYSRDVIELHGTFDCNEYEMIGSDSVEFSIMENVYCDFLYASDEDWRFRRISMFYDLLGNPDHALEFIRTYHPDNNEGTCGDYELPSTENEQTLPIDAATIALFEDDLLEWLDELGL